MSSYAQKSNEAQGLLASSAFMLLVMAARIQCCSGFLQIQHLNRRTVRVLWDTIVLNNGQGVISDDFRRGSLGDRFGQLLPIFRTRGAFVGQN
jgi:hypothetical protein